MAFAQSQQIFDKNIRTSLVSDLQNQLLTKLGWSKHKDTFVATYSRCWLGSLKCLNNIVHALGNCNHLFWICFYIIKSIINRSFLDFFSSVPWGIYCVNFSLMWSFYQGTTSVTSTTEPTSAASVGTGENLFSSSLHVVSWDPYSQLHLPTSIKKYG